MHPEQRIHALDAVRAIALLAGIVLHGTMSFLPDLISLGWPIADRSPSLALEVVFYVIHIFRMSAFFLIAGFFAHLMLHRKGAQGFVRDRLRRIAGPMVGFWALSIGLLTVVIVWAVYKHNGGVMPSAPPPARPGLPLTHIWFLYYLVLFYATALVVREAMVRVIDRSGNLRKWMDQATARMVNAYVAPIVLAVPAAAALYYLRPSWEWAGIPTPEYGLTPIPSTYVAYGTAFAFGWFLHRQTSLLRTFEHRWGLHLTLAIAATVSAWQISGAPLPLNQAIPESVKLLYAAIYMFACWNWVFALLGIALKFLASPSPAFRYLADSSYWMYLIHLPLVFALQTVIMDWNLHWTLKFPLLIAVTLALLLASYHLFVRRTWLGQLLNGKRHPRRIDETSLARAGQP